ncbi:MAG TPA: DUF4136 domain-containing protein [Terriglobales bacterium]
MRRHLFLQIATLTTMILIGRSAQGQKVSLDYDKATNFSKFATYAWVRGTPVPNETLDQYIILVSDGMLEKKGLRRVEPQNADLLFTYHAAGDSDLNVGGVQDPTYSSVGGVPLEGQTVWSTGGAAPTRLIRKGQLAVQVLDRSGHKIVWTGTASVTIKEKRGEKLDQLDNALTKLYDRFPPPATSK